MNGVVTTGFMKNDPTLRVSGSIVVDDHALSAPNGQHRVAGRRRAWARKSCGARTSAMTSGYVIVGRPWRSANCTSQTTNRPASSSLNRLVRYPNRTRAGVRVVKCRSHGRTPPRRLMLSRHLLPVGADVLDRRAAGAAGNARQTFEAREPVRDRRGHHVVPRLPRPDAHQHVSVAPLRKSTPSIATCSTRPSKPSSAMTRLLPPPSTNSGRSLSRHHLTAAATCSARRGTNEPLGGSADAKRRQRRQRHSRPRLNSVIRHARILPVPSTPQSRRRGCTARTVPNRPAQAAPQAASPR